jgi:BirA family biotin operon repressor/biotin-[acetyl-CoA-carboxylase] ligase
MSRALADAELLPLADALASGDWQSGETLAQAAGVTRAALAKRIAHLEDWGLEIEARAGLGYRLAQPLQRLDADAIRVAMSPAANALLRGLAVELRLDSTNERLATADAAQDPQALFAEAQTAGRGRRGREWRSPFGVNLYLSLAWSFPGWPAQLGTLPLAIGVAVARALEAIGVPGVMLKWPNDLRVGNAKLGGILIEQRGEFGGACRVVIGLGLNVAMRESQAGLPGVEWTSVGAVREAAGLPPLSRTALAAAVLGALVEAVAQFERGGFAPFAADWLRLDLARGREVRIEGPYGTRAGIALGIDADGALRVEFDGQVESVHAGEVSLRLPT